MDLDKVNSWFTRADEMVTKNEYPPDTELGKNALKLLEKLHADKIAESCDWQGDGGGGMVLKTKDGKDFPVLVSYVIPLVVPNYLDLKETKSSLTFDDLPKDSMDKLTKTAEEFGFTVMSVSMVEEIGKSRNLSLDDMYSEYLYY